MTWRDSGAAPSPSRGRRGVVMADGSMPVPRELLEPLLTKVRLSGSEWRIVTAVLLSPTPPSGRALAQRLGLAYPLVKRVVRGLLAWQILERTPEGLGFQPDAARWGVERSSAGRNRGAT